MPENILAIFDALLLIHIISGFTSLSAAAGALSVKKGATIHRLCGRIFVIGMTGIFFTAIPMCLIKRDAFLFLIALFSYYFAISGWRYAKNRSGIASYFSWAIAVIMLLVGVFMIIYGFTNLNHSNYQPIVLMIFGAIACSNSFSDLRAYYDRNAVGNFRIIRHLSSMLGATIAAATAFTVVNVHTNPAYLAWIAPAVIITPIIIWWTNRVKRWPEQKE